MKRTFKTYSIRLGLALVTLSSLALAGGAGQRWW
jgi:hypothetical protein